MSTIKSSKAAAFELPVSKLVTMRDIQTMADFIQRFRAKYASKKSLNMKKSQR